LAVAYAELRQCAQLAAQSGAEEDEQRKGRQQRQRQQGQPVGHGHYREPAQQYAAEAARPMVRWRAGWTNHPWSMPMARPLSTMANAFTTQEYFQACVDEKYREDADQALTTPIVPVFAAFMTGSRTGCKHGGKRGR
jgi:hypothetical protein